MASGVKTIKSCKKWVDQRQGGHGSWGRSLGLNLGLSCSLCLSLTLSLGISLSPFVCAAQVEPQGWAEFYARGQEAAAELKPADAEKDFRQALKLAEAGGAESEPALKCLQKLADVLTTRNKTAEAQSLYQRLLSILVKKHGETKPIVPVLMSLGSIQESLGDHSAANVYYQRALRINEKNYGPYSPEFVKNIHAMARANAHNGHKAAAVKQYKQTIDALMDEPSLAASQQLVSVIKEYNDLIKNNDDSDKGLISDFQKDILGETRSNGTQAKGAPGKLRGGVKTTGITNTTAQQQASSPVHSPAITMKPPAGMPELRPEIPVNGGREPSTVGVRDKIYTPPTYTPPVGTSAWQDQVARGQNDTRQSQVNEDPDIVLRSMNQPWSASTLLPAFKTANDSVVNQSRYAAGEDGYKRMIATDINALGAHHPSVANDLNGLAQFYMHNGRYGDAEPLLRDAKDIYEQAYGLDNPLTINVLISYGQVESRLGRTDQALALYQSALAHSQTALGPNSMATARVLNELAYLYFHEGKLEQARTYYKWAVASTEAAAGDKSLLLAASLSDYARVLRSLGDQDQAAVLENRAAVITASK